MTQAAPQVQRNSLTVCVCVHAHAGSALHTYDDWETARITQWWKPLSNNPRVLLLRRDLRPHCRRRFVFGFLLYAIFTLLFPVSDHPRTLRESPC